MRTSMRLETRLNPYLIIKELIGKVETHLNIQLYQVLWNVWIYFFPNLTCTVKSPGEL